jgi:hypothetical protein
LESRKTDAYIAALRLLLADCRGDTQMHHSVPENLGSKPIAVLDKLLGINAEISAMLKSEIENRTGSSEAAIAWVEQLLASTNDPDRE